VNSLRNLPAIAAGHDVRALADAYLGLPAIIAAAGPLLDRAIPQLQQAAGRALLIASVHADSMCATLASLGYPHEQVVRYPVARLLPVG
jgi:hypothetical protein